MSVMTERLQKLRDCSHVLVCTYIAIFLVNVLDTTHISFFVYITMQDFAAMEDEECPAIGALSKWQTQTKKSMQASRMK